MSANSSKWSDWIVGATGIAFVGLVVESLAGDPQVAKTLWLIEHALGH